MKKAQAGFTLIELVIVIIIVAILAAASVPIYRNYVRRAVAAEGTALAGSVLAAARVYFTENQGAIYVTYTHATEAVTPILGVDARSNRYFTQWTATLDRPNAAANWTVTAGVATCTDTQYTGLVVNFNQTQGGVPHITVAG